MTITNDSGFDAYIESAELHFSQAYEVE